MRVTIRPSANPNQEIDVTRALIGAVAAELWRAQGGNDVLNWMEAEQFIASLVAQEPTLEAEPKPRPRPRPADSHVKHRRLNADSEPITGPLPVY